MAFMSMCIAFDSWLANTQNQKAQARMCYDFVIRLLATVLEFWQSIVLSQKEAASKCRRVIARLVKRAMKYCMDRWRHHIVENRKWKLMVFGSWYARLHIQKVATSMGRKVIARFSNRAVTRCLDSWILRTAYCKSLASSLSRSFSKEKTFSLVCKDLHEQQTQTDTDCVVPPNFDLSSKWIGAGQNTRRLLGLLETFGLEGEVDVLANYGVTRERDLLFIDDEMIRELGLLSPLSRFKLKKLSQAFQLDEDSRNSAVDVSSRVVQENCDGKGGHGVIASSLVVQENCDSKGVHPVIEFSIRSSCRKHDNGTKKDNSECHDDIVPTSEGSARFRALKDRILRIKGDELRGMQDSQGALCVLPCIVDIGQVVKHSVMYCKTSIPHNTHIFYQTRNRIDHCQTFSDIRVFHEKYIFDRETGQILIPRYFLFDCFYFLMTAYVSIQNVLIFGSI